MISPEVIAFCPTSCLLSVQVPAGVCSLVALWLAKEHFPSALTFSQFPVVAVVEQERWKSWGGGDAVVVKPEDLSFWGFF